MSSSDLLARAVANVIPKDLAEQKLKSGQQLRVYLGIDPTGSQLHLGHSVTLHKLQAFADAGHEAILVIGSFTAMIGDPSERDEVRKPLTREQVEENFRLYREQASKVLDFNKVQVRYNHEWLEKLTPLEIMKLASIFTKQQLEQRDMFERRERGGKPIFLNEFLYPLFQGYDSVYLDVDCELGATDQEFNMLCGRTLQTAFGKRDKFVLTTHLIPGLDGRKMSKTYENCVYLDDRPSDMYGKLMSLSDKLIPLYMECCTDVPMDEVMKIHAMLRSSKHGMDARNAKSRLAREIVLIYHGEKAAREAEEEFVRIFKEKGTPEHIREARVGKGSTLIDVLLREKLVPSKSEARRLIQQGGVHLNGMAVHSLDAKVEQGVVRVGKRKFLKVILHEHEGAL